MYHVLCVSCINNTHECRLALVMLNLVHASCTHQYRTYTQVHTYGDPYGDSNPGWGSMLVPIWSHVGAYMHAKFQRSWPSNYRIIVVAKLIPLFLHVAQMRRQGGKRARALPIRNMRALWQPKTASSGPQGGTTETQWPEWTGPRSRGQNRHSSPTLDIGFRSQLARLSEFHGRRAPVERCQI